MRLLNETDDMITRLMDELPQKEWDLVEETVFTLRDQLDTARSLREERKAAKVKIAQKEGEQSPVVERPFVVLTHDEASMLEAALEHITDPNIGNRLGLEPGCCSDVVLMFRNKYNDALFGIPLDTDDPYDPAEDDS